MLSALLDRVGPPLVGEAPCGPRHKGLKLVIPHVYYHSEIVPTGHLHLVLGPNSIIASYICTLLFRTVFTLDPAKPYHQRHTQTLRRGSREIAASSIHGIHASQLWVQPGSGLESFGSCPCARGSSEQTEPHPPSQAVFLYYHERPRPFPFCPCVKAPSSTCASLNPNSSVRLAPTRKLKACQNKAVPLTLVSSWADIDVACWKPKRVDFGFPSNPDRSRCKSSASNSAVPAYMAVLLLTIQTPVLPFPQT